MTLNEKQFEQQVRGIALLYNWLYYHTWNSRHSAAGFPDCIMVRDGQVVYAELKVGENKPSPEQQEWLDALANAGQEVYLWYPDDYDEIISVLNSKRR